jgi:hypothetical protein
MALHLIRANAILYEPVRCGTTWIREALTAAGIEWRPARPVEGVCPRHSLPHHYPGTFRGSACPVRHPREWLESYWRYHVGEPLAHDRAFRRDRWYAHQLFPDRIPDDFGEFATWFVTARPAGVTRYFEWFAGPSGGERVDRVLRQERLADELADWLERLGYDRPDLSGIERVNQRAGETRWPIDVLTRFVESERAMLARWYE